MPKYNYVAMDARGKEAKGTLEVTNQNEAIGRVKEMGLFPTKIIEVDKIKGKPDGMELVLTGRGAPPEIIEAADLVTEMREIRHYYSKGVDARVGVER